jgi:hypothetical protein
LVPPAATQAVFDPDTAKVGVTFNQNVSVSMTVGDYTVQGPGMPGGTFSPAGVSYDAINNKVSFTMPALADGNYTLTLTPATVSDSWGNRPSANYVASFFSVAGDADHDRDVDTADFTQMATYFNQAGMTFSKGDFNGDGKVNALDFNILAAKYGTHLAAAPSLGATVFDALANPTANLFGAAPIRNDLLDARTSGALA